MHGARGLILLLYSGDGEAQQITYTQKKKKKNPISIRHIWVHIILYCIHTSIISVGTVCSDSGGGGDNGDVLVVKVLGMEVAVRRCW